GNLSRVTPAQGAGQEVGRSCIILEFKAGLRDPSWSGGDGRSALHRPDRPC
uniref:Uncharacterized protein n=1 Tax=Poecilia reticulata TaxID=8081 RepID=A0A3P9PK08_POERE